MMNERMLEIAFKSLFITKRVSDDSYFINDPKLMAKLEKFAELIVRQMLDITDAHTEVFQTDRDRALIEHIKQSVKQHFGVEE